ncbi:MAG: phage portal protein [Candidatus Helarchaeota archaeon]
MGNIFNALEEHPYLDPYGEDLGIETELNRFDSLVGLRAISSKMLKDSPIAAALLMGYLNAFMGGNIFFDVIGAEYVKNPLKKILFKQFKAMDINRLIDLNLFMEYIITGAFKSGDILIHTPYDKNYINNKTGLSTLVELITADRIVTPYNLINDPMIRNGVKYKTNGYIEGFFVKSLKMIFEDYWRTNHKNYEFIPIHKELKIGGTTYTRQISYLFKSALFDEGGTARVFPALIPSSKYIRLIDNDIKAIVIGMYTAACFAGFITGTNPYAAKRDFEANQKPNLKGIGRLSPGMIYFLKKGDTITFGSPQRPADNTDSFIQRLLILCSASVRSPYEISYLHLAGTSFSASKIGANEIMANRNRWLNRLTNLANFLAYTFSFEALVEGVVKSIKDVSFSFRFPKYDPLDKQKSAIASRIDLQSEVTSKKEEIEDRNLDYEEINEQLNLEAIDAVKRHGLILKEQNRLEKEYNIVFSDNEKVDRETAKRKGEQSGSDIDPDDANIRRQTDANY